MFSSFGCGGDSAAGTARTVGNRAVEDHVTGTSPTPGLPDMRYSPSQRSPATRPSHPSGAPNYLGDGGLCPPSCGGGFNLATATAAVAGDSKGRRGQPGFPATQQPQQPQYAPQLQSPPNPQLASLVWDSCQPPPLQLPQPHQPGPPRLQQQQPQQEHQRPRSQLEQQPVAHLRAPAQTALAGPPGVGPCQSGAAFYRRPSSLSRADVVLSVRQDEHALDEPVDRLLSEIQSAPWPAPDPRFGTNALLSTWHHSAAAAAAAATAAAAPPAGGPAAAPPPPWSPRGAPHSATRGVEPLAAADVGPAGRGTAGLVPVVATTAAAYHSAGMVLSASSVDAGLVAGAAPSRLGPASLQTASAASDTMGSPFVTLGALWAQEASATRGSCPQLHAMGLLGNSSSLHSASTLAAGSAGLLPVRSWNLPPGADAAADAVGAAGSASAVLGLAQSMAPPHAPLATSCAFLQPPSQSMVLLPGGPGEPLGGPRQPFAPAGPGPASVTAIDVEQLFGGAGALAAAAAPGPSCGSDGWHVGGVSPAGAAPGAGGGGGGTGLSMQLSIGRQSILSDSADMSFSGAEDTDEAGDAFMDFSDADLSFAGVDSGGGGGGGLGGGAGDGGGGGGGRSLTLDDLRPLFDRQVGDVVRLLRVGVNDFKRRCRALGIRRWPQRKLLSLRKLEDAVRGDSGLSEERRQILLASIARNREAILEAPDTDLEPGLKLLRQLHYKRLFVSRQAAGGGNGRGGGGGGRPTVGPSAAAAATTAVTPSAQQRLTRGGSFAPLGSPMDTATAAAAAASAPISALSLAAWSELPDVAVPDAAGQL